jgi:hypothetical protein
MPTQARRHDINAYFHVVCRRAHKTAVAGLGVSVHIIFFHSHSIYDKLQIRGEASASRVAEASP